VASATLTPGVTSFQRCYPYGEPRDAYSAALPTDHTFTGQITDGLLDDGGTGLMYYQARYYDPQVGRFAAADTIVPNPANPQDLNRYTYVRNNPVNGIDPSGHGELGDWLRRLVELVDLVLSFVQAPRVPGPQEFGPTGPLTIADQGSDNSWMAAAGVVTVSSTTGVGTVVGGALAVAILIKALQPSPTEEMRQAIQTTNLLMQLAWEDLYADMLYRERSRVPANITVYRVTFEGGDRLSGTGKYGQYWMLADPRIIDLAWAELGVGTFQLFGIPRRYPDYVVYTGHVTNLGQIDAIQHSGFDEEGGGLMFAEVIVVGGCGRIICNEPPEPYAPVIPWP